METNIQWIYDNTPRGRWYETANSNYGTDYSNRTLVTICGRVFIPKNKKESTFTRRVGLGRAFDPSCNPIVTLGICADSADKEIFAVVNGATGILPNATGFDILTYVRNGANGVGKKKWALAKGYYIFWQATGWKEVGINEYTV